MRFGKFYTLLPDLGALDIDDIIVDQSITTEFDGDGRQMVGISMLVAKTSTKNEGSKDWVVYCNDREQFLCDLKTGIDFSAQVEPILWHRSTAELMARIYGQETTVTIEYYPSMVSDDNSVELEKENLYQIFNEKNNVYLSFEDGIVKWGALYEALTFDMKSALLILKNLPPKDKEGTSIVAKSTL